MTETTALTLAAGNALELVDALEDRAIAAAIKDQLEETWVYQFPMNGKTVTGVSAKGVENGAREMAKLGEPIRELDVRLEYEDDNEARFVAKAGRYGVSGDGREVLLDTAIRGKRQSKKFPEGGPNKDWYEQGITKAVRNAKLALMPDSIVALIIANAKKAGRLTLLDGQGRPQQQRQVPQRSQQRTPRANVDGETGEIIDSPAPASVDSSDPVQLLNAIAQKHGQPAKVAAINVMTRLYDTGVVTKLDGDQRADFVGILRFRLAGTAHEHEGKFTAQGLFVCGRCGEELEDNTSDLAEVEQGALV